MPKLNKEEKDWVKFINEYHKNTIKNKLARRNEDGSITTVLATGIPYEGKIYLVPSYIGETGQVLDQAEAYKYWSPKLPEMIKNNAITGIPDDWVGKDISEHPANIVAKKNHYMLENESVPSSSIKWDFLKKK